MCANVLLVTPKYFILEHVKGITHYCPEHVYVFCELFIFFAFLAKLAAKLLGGQCRCAGRSTTVFHTEMSFGWIAMKFGTFGSNGPQRMNPLQWCVRLLTCSLPVCWTPFPSASSKHLLQPLCRYHT